MSTDTPAWSDDDLSHNPHAAADKAKRVEQMFAAIAPSYDLNNRLHSLWRDQAWRRAAVKMAKLQPDDVVADIACGTGDLSMAFQKGGAARVVGIDFTVPMLGVADEKHNKNPGDAPLTYQAGDAMRLPLADQTADVVSIAFGIRNVADPAKAMAEFVRVLRPGGRVIVLEFSLPKNSILRGGYNFYFKHILPRTASLIARDKSGAYKYLPKSVNTFIDRAGMTAMMEDAGLTDIAVKPLTCGIAVCYRGTKT
ncbi:bifunctional demethylmenaquinone methyltransferase/2-methoxy-6-polyprenyl-1,4-benzoquinol methylase UbiE [Phycisphaeraceae bacterium D3-23]